MSLNRTYLQAALIYLLICRHAAAGQSPLCQADGYCQATNNTELNSNSPTFDYWIDFHAYRAYDSARVYDEALASLGGQRACSPPLSKDNFESQVAQRTGKLGTPSKDGYHNMDNWDVYITTSRRISGGSYQLTPGQLINSVPGSTAITLKQNMVQTLRKYYGQGGTDDLVPRTFLLPQERSKWQKWLQKHPEQDAGFWLLKNNQHRAEGVNLVPTSEAQAAILQGGRKWSMIQQYISNPLLLGGRKFSVRLHVFIPPGLDQFRVYVHNRGLAFFSLDDYVSSSNTSSSAAAASRKLPTGLPSGHFTNNAAQQGVDGSGIKELATIRQEVGEDIWRELWDSMTSSTARVMAAASAYIRKANSKLKMPARSAYELFGVDFLIDDHMRVWVTEVNAGPSMKLGTDDSPGFAVRQFVKSPATKDMFSMMQLQDRNWNQPQQPVLDFNEFEAELQLRGGWLPLMHLFSRPRASMPSSIQDIPWTEADLQLQGWIKSSHAYKQAMVDWYQ